MSPRRIVALVTLLTCALFLSVAVYAQNPPAGKKEFAFKGKVEKVDEKSKMVTVNNESIPGWLASMTMAYRVDKADVLKTVKAGDSITATVYDGDYQTLYNIKVAPAAKK